MRRSGLCYECVLIDQGHKPVERHHPFGRDNPIVAGISLEIPGNWHRAVDIRHARRPEILKRPGENPLHQIAAAIATFGEAADVVADVARRQEWAEWIVGLADIFANAAALTWFSPASWMSGGRVGLRRCRNGARKTGPAEVSWTPSKVHHSRTCYAAGRDPRILRSRSAEALRDFEHRQAKAPETGTAS